MARSSSTSATDTIAQIARVADRDPAKAASMAIKAQADGVRSPYLHHLLGIELKNAGRFEEAIVEMGKGLELAPDDARLMTTVGFCLLELDRRQEAAQVFSAAMTRDPGLAEASFGYGWTAERLGALAAAKSAYERAVDLNPRYADPLAGLAGIATRRREWDQARELAERAVAVDPMQTDALTNLARIDIGVADFDAAQRRLTEIIGMPSLKPVARANARLLLGDALDGAGRFRDAYDAYAHGKAELNDLYAPEFGPPAARPAAASVKALMEEFLETPAAAWTAPPAAQTTSEREHLFLTGFPRSGTTLLEQILATHPNVSAVGERPLMLHAEAQFLTRPGGIKHLADIVGDSLAPYRDAYWQRAREFGGDPTDKVFVDKHPLASVRLPLIHKMFPRAKVLFAVRDPRDVIFSCFRRGFNMNAAMYAFNSVVEAAKYYDAAMSASEIYFDRLEIQALRIRNEDLVRDFEGSVRAICEFVSLPWTEELRNFADGAAERAIATPSNVQVGRGLYDDAIGQWRNYAFALEPVHAILAPWIEKFGYPPT